MADQKMYMLQWDSVLIQWVNCLEMSIPIETIADLKNGCFFKELLQSLTETVICIEELMPNLHRFFKNNFINFKIFEETAKLDTISISDITKILSLLMYYTCIVDRQDRLTAPLCYKLPTEVQLQVKVFLENCKVDVAANDINEILKMCFDSSSQLILKGVGALNQWHSAGDSPSTRNSPLQEFLKTPGISRTARLQEKDRMIKNLKHELQMEKYEKDDLTIELKEQKQKIQKINEQVAEKTKIISKLRNELLALENRTPPHKPIRFQEIERLLRAELLDSQHYISHLQAEQEALQNSKEEIARKLHKTEQEACFWQTKAITSEREYEVFAVKHTEQELELNNLRMNCNELTALLDELRSNHSKNESLELDYSGIKSTPEKSFVYENLASTVVDVQLKEVQLENDNLLKSLNESATKSLQLENKLLQVKNDFDDLNSNYKSLQKTNDLLEEHILELKNSQTNLHDANLTLHQNIKQLTNISEIKDNEILSLQKSVTNVNNTLAERNDLIKTLETDFSNLQNNFDELKESMLTRNHQYEQLQSESEHLQNLYEESLENCSMQKLDYDAICKIYKELDELIGVNLAKLEYLVTGTSNITGHSKTNVFDQLLHKLEERNDNTQLAYLNYQSEIEHYKSLNVSLELKIEEFKDCEKSNNKRIRLLSDILENAKKEINQLECKIDSQDVNITELNNIIEDFKMNINDLEKLKLVAEDKDKEIKSLEEFKVQIMMEFEKTKKEYKLENSKKQSTIEELDLSKANLEAVIDDKNKRISEIMLNEENLKIELTNMKQNADAASRTIEELELINQNNLKKEKEQLEEISKLNYTIENYNKIIETLETNLNIAEQNIKSKNLTIEDLNKFQAEIKNSYEIHIKDLKKKLNILESTHDSLKINYDEVSAEKSSLTRDLAIKIEEINCIKEEMKLYVVERDSVAQEKYNLLGRLQKTEKQYLDLDELNTKSSRECLQLKLEIECKNKEITALDDNINSLKKENENLINKVTNIKGEKVKLESRIEDIIMQIEVLRKAKIHVELILEDLTTKAQMLLKEAGIKEDEIIAGLKNLMERKEKLQSEYESIKFMLEEANIKLEHANEENVTLTTSYEIKIKELTKTISDLNKEIDGLKTQEIGSLQDIGILKDELSGTIEKYTEALQVERDLKIENNAQICSLTENIHAMVAKYNSLDTKHTDILEELSYIKNEHEELLKSKLQSEIDLIKQKQEFEDDMQASKEQYRLDLQCLEEKEEKLKRELNILNNEIVSVKGSKHRIQQELEKSKEDLQIIYNEKMQLLSKLESLIETNNKFEIDNGDLRIQHENYLKESKLTLSKTQLEMQEKVVNLKTQIMENEKQIHDLKLALENMQKETVGIKIKHEEDIDQKNKELEILNEKIIELNNSRDSLENKVTTLSEELDLNKTNKIEYSKKDKQLNGLQNKIVKLNVLYEIYNSGKRRIDEAQDQLIEKQNALLDKKEIATEEFDEILCKFEANSKCILNQLQERANEVDNKEKEMVKINEELNNVQSIVELMKSECESSMSNNRILEDKLFAIEEDSSCKINDQLKRFEFLKCKYDQIKKELKEVAADYDNLKEDLVEVSQSKAEVDKQMTEMEQKIAALQNKYDSVINLLMAKDLTITSLQEELECNLDKLESISWEKRCTESKLEQRNKELISLIQACDETKVKHAKLIQDTEKNFLRAHDNAVDVKNDLKRRFETADKDRMHALHEKEAIELLLAQEKKSKELFELQVLELKNEQSKCKQLQKTLHNNFTRLLNLVEDSSIIVNEECNFEDLNEMIVNTESRIIEIFSNTRQLDDIVKTLEKNKSEIESKLKEMEICNLSLNEEKKMLMANFDEIHQQKNAISMEKDKETKSLENLKAQYELLKEKYEKIIQNQNTNKNSEISLKLEELKIQNKKYYDDYQEFVNESKLIKKNIDKMIGERNSVENIISTIKENHVSLLIKSVHLTEDYRLHYEQKNALDLIVQDIQKQFSRLSKIVYNTSLNIVQIFEKTVTGILMDKPIKWQILFKELNIQETLDKLEDLKDNSTNTLEQLITFQKNIESINYETKPNVLKENIKTTASSCKVKDEDWKKKYTNLKQRLTLVENTKNNYEKKIKQLREENKNLLNKPKTVKSDDSFKQLEQQHLQFKQEHELLVAKYSEVLCEIEDYRSSATNVQQDKELKLELHKLRDAYKHIKSDHCQMELDNATLQNKLEERNAQLASLHSVKEAYEKLFEDNNKLMAEIDTLKYKRNRDREEYIRLIKKEKEEGESCKKVQEVRAEYEVKLAKMKDRMITLYKEEVDKQIEKVATEKEENEFLARTLDKLKNDLSESNQKLKDSENEKLVLMKQLNTSHQNMDTTDAYNLRDSIGNRDSGRCMVKRASTQSLGGHELIRTIEDRRYSTLPKNVAGMDVIEEVHIRRRTSINSVPTSNLEMEDEGEMFNNKYLVDLKEGRYSLSNTGRESTSSRMSELAYRNSLCLPHLKSSYPAETQFVNPRRFRENDIRTGQIDLDDSMSARLLPHDKPKKKDIGTTSYKRPGPPTPSKNGGRSSLQGNEIHPREVLRDANERTRTTPNRLRALFSRSKDSSENVPVTPKGKRLSIFRKPR